MAMLFSTISSKALKWESPTYTPEQALEVKSMATNGTNLWVAALNCRISGYDKMLAAYSEDNAKTWHLSTQPNPNYLPGITEEFNSVAFGNGVFYLDGKYSYTSSDGKQWNAVSSAVFGSEDRISVGFAPYKVGNARGIFLAASPQSIWRSLDLPNSWQLVHRHSADPGAGNSPAILQIYNINFSYGNNHLVMTGSSTPGEPILHYSADFGATWIAVPPPAETIGSVHGLTFAQGEFVGIGGAAKAEGVANPQPPNPVGGVIVTSPNGRNWTTQSIRFDKGLSAIAYDPKLDLFLVCTNANEFFSSKNKITWQPYTAFPNTDTGIARINTLTALN